MVWRRFASTSEIASAAQEFARGYYECADDSSQLRIVIGTSNSGGYVTEKHGQAWARMVNEVGSWLESRGIISRVKPAGGIDAEPDWNSPTITRLWVNGYASLANWPLSNFGAAYGCPEEGTSSTAGMCSSGWSQEDIWYISWGALPSKSMPLPQIYHTGGRWAKHWQQLSLYSYLAHGSRMNIAGSLTQYQACQQNENTPRECNPTERNTPEQGWQQLYTELNSDPRTAQNLPWATDIKWWQG